MTFFDFLDKHWSFWFAVFLLMLAGSVAHGLAALLGLVVKLLRR